MTDFLLSTWRKKDLLPSDTNTDINLSVSVLSLKLGLGLLPQPHFTQFASIVDFGTDFSVFLETGISSVTVLGELADQPVLLLTVLSLGTLGYQPIILLTVFTSCLPH